MDNAIGDIKIIEVLKHNYKSLYNSVPTSDTEMQCIYLIVTMVLIGFSYRIFM